MPVVSEFRLQPIFPMRRGTLKRELRQWEMVVGVLGLCGRVKQISRSDMLVTW